MVRGAEGECLETRYQYDLKDRLTHQVTQGGAVTRYLYNQNDQLIKEIRPHGYEAGTDEGTETAYSYDCRGKTGVDHQWPRAVGKGVGLQPPGFAGGGKGRSWKRDRT